MRIANIIAIVLTAAIGCGPGAAKKETVVADSTAEPRGQSAVSDADSEKNILQTAMASPDHTMLASALKAAGYEDAICNCGPFTLFAPTDEAFGHLPAGQLSDLMKPENRNALRDVLEYHVYIGVIPPTMIRHRMVLGQVNGEKVTLTKQGDTLRVNAARILKTIRVSNGIIYAIDQVLVPE